jgi:DNA ligase-1
MLACSIDADKLSQKSYVKSLRFPFLASPKWDGIRCELTPFDGPVCRSLDPVPNNFIRGILSSYDCIRGAEGELVVGDATASNVYNVTESAVMTRDGQPDFKLYLFDDFESGLYGAEKRLDILMEKVFLKNQWLRRIHVVSRSLVYNLDEMLEYETALLSEGFEGVCFRHVNALYKHGRSTLRSGELLRLIREATAEGTIIDFNERMTNQNEATINALGYTERSSHKANKVGAGELGAFWVSAAQWAQPFKVAPGNMSQPMRKHIWDNRKAYKNKVLVFKYKPHGEKNVPRQPRFKGWRSAVDMSE